MIVTWKIVVEVLTYFFVALAILVLWFTFPVLSLRAALVVLYLVLVRWAWKRGN